ncbi:MAG: hypothetical protein ACT4OX_06560 [Actinomycetota bacterium]
MSSIVKHDRDHGRGRTVEFTIDGEELRATIDVSQRRTCSAWLVSTLWTTTSVSFEGVATACKLRDERTIEVLSNAFGVQE